MLVSRFDRGKCCSLKSEAWESQRGMKLEQSGSEEGIGPGSKKHRVMLLHATALVVMVDLEEEDIVEEVVRSVVELSLDYMELSYEDI